MMRLVLNAFLFACLLVPATGWAQAEEPKDEAKPTAEAAPPPPPPGGPAGPGGPGGPGKPGGPRPRPAAADPEQMFKQADKDNNGALSLEEFKAIRGQMRERSAAPSPRQHIQNFIQRADADKDGKVSQEEFKKAMPNAPEDRFTRMDRNKDSAITADDVPAGPPEGAGREPQGSGKPEKKPDPNRSQGFFTKADANQDAKLSFEEVTAAKPGFLKETFDTMDANKDGNLEKEEFQAARKAKQEAAATPKQP